MKTLTGMTAVVTGAASGIGLAMAHHFGDEGMKLMLADVESGPLHDATTTLAAKGYDVASYELRTFEI